LIEIHFVELGKFFRTADELSNSLDQWCYLLRNGEELEPKNLPTNMTSDAIRKAVEVLQNMNMNKEERMIYEARRKAEIDALYYQTSPEQFEEIGRKKGLEEGLLQGLRKGKIEGKEEGILLGKLGGMLEL
jgi:predicted transposase/invertase (TIGR01784 family)